MSTVLAETPATSQRAWNEATLDDRVFTTILAAVFTLLTITSGGFVGIASAPEAPVIAGASEYSTLPTL
jgi:hypothetical protein